MRDPGRSFLFARYQNPVLAAEAREMSKTFADSSYLRRLTGEENPESAWEAYFAHSQPQVRGALDGLLATIPPEERERAVELAGSVEVFCLPSNAVESRVFVNPGEATGYLIGIAPLTVQLTADIAWGMNMVHPSATDAHPRNWDAEAGREALDEHIMRYVRALQAVGEAPLPVSLMAVALRDHPEWPHGQGPNDYRDAALTFVISHELAHIEHGDLLPAQRPKAQLLLPESTASLLGISAEANEELAADASAFMPCYNYVVGTWMLKNEPPSRSRISLKRREHKKEYQRVARQSARRAAEACEAYYSAVLVLGTFEWLRGDNDTANRLLTAGARAPFIQFYIQRDRQEVLAPQIGSFMWSARDVEYRKAHHSWRTHFTTQVMPEMWAGMGLDIPETYPDVVTQKHLAERLEDALGDPEVVSRVADDARKRLSEQERVRGAQHPTTLQARLEAAFLQSQAGDTAGALAAMEELLPDLVRATGRDSAQVLALRHNVAFLLGKTERTRDAAAAWAALRADQERILGPGHPDVLETRYNLASLRGRAGDAEGAAADFAELVAGEERVRGHDDDHTSAARNALAFWRAKAEDKAGTAARLAEERERTLGPGHPDTLAARRDLAGLRREAVTAAERLLAAQKEVLGPEHPDTRTTLDSLAWWRGKAGDAAGAAATFAELLAVQERVLGPDHRSALLTRSLIILWRGQAGDAAGAASVAEQLLADQLRLLEPDATETLMTHGQLGYWRGKAGDAAGAAAAYADLLAVLRRVQGPDAPGTLSVQRILTEWQSKAEGSAGGSNCS
ncbi:tetratricopeptide repeat protein [Streptomyces sp. NPDC053542]|uniref:tetratricopeptide repeat protein n=1 Tax=Streptomyces sp. NPDC053542 TaxID=3365710 RepID=UPI0037D655E8